MRKMLAASSLFFFFSLLLVLNSRGQVPVKNYEKEWKNAEALKEKGLPKSALEEVKKIYTLAKKEKQDAQVIKALVYSIGLQNETRENNEILSISEIGNELNTSKEPVTSLLKSLLADLYLNYYEEHRWQLYNRTQTEKFSKADIATWGTEDFHKMISDLYLQSIREEKLLEQVELESYNAIILKGNVRHLRPTLFDLLAQRALRYFENDERDLKKPAYAFEISQAYAFDPAVDFVTRPFPTRDSLSLQHKALLIYQKLIAFHLNDKKPDALIDVDLQRIAFVNDNSVHPEKDKLYFDALGQLTKRYGDLPAAAEAWYLLAQYYNEKANGYKPYGDSTHRLDRLKAKEICERVLQQKDSSEGKYHCYNLLNQVNATSFQFSVEKVNIPQQPFRLFLKYRNFNTLFIRLIRADEKLKDLLANQYDEKYWPSLTGATPLKSWQQSLPPVNDLQQHSVELKVDGLAPGEYILLASDEKEFTGKKAILGARFFYVSAISYVNNNNDFFVLDRDNGRPLAGAAVQVWEQHYDYNQSKYIREKGKSYLADANGFFRMEQKKPDRNYYYYSYQLDVSYRGDRLFMSDLVNQYFSNASTTQEPKTINSIFLFTDRSLYRPGQTLFFKGIVLSRNPGEKKAMVNPGYETILFLRDANLQNVDSVKVSTNEYGSFSGKFVLPQSGLNGQFSLYTKTEQAYTGFRVEEYKRPKFYVDYEPIKGTYKVNDNIRITGFAKAYAGNSIDGAMVSFRVVRQPRFIYPWLFWRWWQPPSEEMEIAHGELKTDKDGKFIVEFTAIPDLKIDKKFEPVFDYTVYADVTDINGETRSGEKSISVSYKALILVTDVPTVLPADSLQSISIRSENMNGEHEPAVVTVTVYRLKEESRLIRNRYWDRPDQFLMTKEEYIRNFPNDEYDNESDAKSREKVARVFERRDSTSPGGEWKLEGGKFETGFYAVEVTARDKNGEEVKDVNYIELFDEKSSRLKSPAYLWSGRKKTSVEPGETARVEWGSSADSLFVVQTLDRQTTTENTPATSYSFFRLSNEKKTFNFPATEEDRGGYGVGWMFIRNNRMYQTSQLINVPWTNKDLQIEYASFREKTLPGSEEKWKVRISGYKGEKVAAEMLAGMYDASLDQFYPHGWAVPYVWPYFYSSRRWNGAQNFTEIESYQRYLGPQETKYVVKDYDELFYTFSGMTYGWALGLDNKNPTLRRLAKPVAAADGKVANEGDVTEQKEIKDGEEVRDGTGQTKKETGKVAEKQQAGTDIRKNFNETAFFLPALRTDSSGSIEFSFTMPEALTRWKFMALAHTKEGAFGNSSKEIVTQKELMVQPNAPRFLREGDKMEFSSKIVNLTAKELTGTVELQLFDATTNEPVDGWFGNMVANQYFTVAAGKSELVKFPIEVPYLFNKALVWRVVAKAGDYSDGEENALPVLTNRMLVTETLPLPMRGTGTKEFRFASLLNAGKSETLQHYSFTVEYTSNPAWYAVQALPYLMEFPYECAEQTWNRYYANSLAAFISNSSPRIKQVFEQWKIKDTAALMSNLQKNQQLKAVLLEETPWVLQAKNEAQQKRNIALLFDMIKMSEQLNSAYDKLKQMQSPNGGFVWFSGGPDDRYITQYIVTGIGHLVKLKAVATGQLNKLKAILATAIPYLDRKIKEDYDDLIKLKVNLRTYTPGYTTIQYLYMRSFFPDYAIANGSQTAYNYFRGRVQQNWVRQSKYMQGMIALALYRTGDGKTPAAILRSLKETSITNEELGMYWKDLSGGWFWYQAPIETQSLLIEAFQEAGKDTKSADDLRTWLLKNKQTNNWKTTKATAEACYALLIQGTQWLNEEPSVTIKLGNTTISSEETRTEAGTGYFSKTFEAKNVKPEMGNITVKVGPSTIPSPGNQGMPSWGGIYWQYFEDLDKIATASTPLQLVKKLFVEKNTDRGPVLTPVNDGDRIQVGDKVKVRIELRVDRDMEYVHMKDMRASALEPVNVLSSYKWQGGLGYYESTRDASTNFFFSYLRKGTYVFEYPLFVTHSGNFSNGITTIQCMYAPEFSSHSEGIRINVD